MDKGVEIDSIAGRVISRVDALARTAACTRVHVDFDYSILLLPMPKTEARVYD